ncbi:MAG TPA: YceI family protein [Streptosporangiaceae bacterium]|nr:YceI family protein [Streptosporangiaceae bacterium]
MDSLGVTGSALQAVRDGKLAGSWTLDPGRSQVRLEARAMWGLASVRGVFRQVSGDGVITSAGEVSGVLTVAASSIDTKNRQRDTHLRSATFFDVQNYPDITFTADRIEPAGEAVTIAGSLKVRDQVRPTSLEARASLLGPGELCLEGELRVNRADFGLSWNLLGMASMHNTISVRAVFARQ